jgi:hypothetical protein
MRHNLFSVFAKQLYNLLRKPPALRLFLLQTSHRQRFDGYDNADTYAAKKKHRPAKRREKW